MNSKITASLLTMFAVGVIATAGTVAYFTDTETSTGNTFSAGTIDISVGVADGSGQQNPWTSNYAITNMEPGESGNINLRVKNEGTNPVKVSKRLYGIVGNGGSAGYDCAKVDATWIAYDASSEPECVAEMNVAQDNIQEHIKYTLAVEVYTSTGYKTWQTIKSGADLLTVYNGTSSVELGTIPAGGYMIVKQNYLLDGPSTGNEHQGDGFTFNMEVLGEQLQDADGYATVTLENKSGALDWAINGSDAVNGTLNYKTTGENFVYNFSAIVNAEGSYKLIYVGPTGNYPCTGGIELGTGTFNTTTATTISGTVNTNSIVGGKVWLVPAADFTTSCVDWTPVNTLFEAGGLVDYTKN